MQLRNRKAVITKLGDFVGGIAISPDLIDTICNSPVNEIFVDALAQLDSKLDYVNSQLAGTKSIDDVRAAPVFFFMLFCLFRTI